MKNPAGAQSPSASAPTHSKKPIEPNFSSLPNMPATAGELVHGVPAPVTASVEQPDPKGERPKRRQQYALPWAGFQSWRDARRRLAHFEVHFKGSITWAPFNDSDANDGPMSLN